MIGIIDIGSNTVRLNIYKIFEDRYQLLVDEKEMVGLANHIVNNEMSNTGNQPINIWIQYRRSF